MPKFGYCRNTRKNIMQHRRLTSLLSAAWLAAGYVACGNSASEDTGSGGTPATGGIASGGGSNSGGLGGDIIIPIGSGGRATGGQGTGGQGTGGQVGSLAVCDTGEGLSVGDPTKSLLIEDFEDEDGFYGNGLAGGFYAFTDGTGTQSPTGSPIGGSPRPDEGFALHVVGNGQTVWGSGFGAILASQGVDAECVFDASAYKGFSFWAKGSITSDGTGTTDRPGLLRAKVLEKDVVPFSLGGNCPDGDGCYDAAGANLELSECWQLYSLNFADLLTEDWGESSLPLDLDELFTIEFGVAQRQDYDIWIDDLRFFVGSKPTAEPVCDDGMGGMGGMTP